MFVPRMAKAQKSVVEASAEKPSWCPRKPGHENQRNGDSFRSIQPKPDRRISFDLTRIPAFSRSSASRDQPWASTPKSFPALQPMLRVGPKDDAYEREADQVADAFAADALSSDRKAGLASTFPAPSLAGAPTAVRLQRKCQDGEECGECQECKQKASLQRKPLGEAPGSFAPPSVQEVLRSPGAPLAESVRQLFEPSFARDFSQVRVHDDARAARSASAVQARAYTVGRDLVFGASQYAPDNPAGRRLIAHELTHVMQQSVAGRENVLQRDPIADKAAEAQQKPDPASTKCWLSNSEIYDGAWSELFPARQGPGGGLFDVVVVGRTENQATSDGILHRIIDGFVKDAYAAAAPDKQADAIHFLNAEKRTPDMGQMQPGCAYSFWIDPVVMNHLRDITGIEIRTKQATAKEKDKEERAARQRARVEAGKQAEQREKAAGLPPPPGSDNTQPGNPAGSPKRASGSEYEGPGKSGANVPALPATLKGPELQPTHGTGTYTMDLDYSSTGSDLLSQVTARMNFVTYHWERFDITDLVLKGLYGKNAKALKQQAISKNAEVGPLAATGRRAEYAYEDLKQESENSASDLLHPTQSATTGSASEVASKAIANYENLTLLPASAIVAAGGWALGALADLLGGTFEEREIPWPDKPGYYMVRCIAQPDSSGDSHRAASVAVKTVELRSLEKLAKNALLLPQAELEEKRAALEIAKKKTPPDPKEIERLTRELGELEVKTNGPATSVIEQKIKADEKEKEGATDYRKTQLEKEIEVLNDQLHHAQEGAKGLGNIFRPQATLVSKVTGETYPLLLQMGTVEPTNQKFAYSLSDVTSRDGKQYHGEGETPAVAAWNAVRDFASHNDYGLGVIGIAMPEGAAFQFPANNIASEPRDVAITKKRINDLVSVLIILGLIVPGLGEVALVLGAALAAEHLIERWQNDTLRFDESTVGDIIGVLSAVFAGASIIGKLTVVRTSESFLLKSLVAAGKAAEVGNKVLNYGGMMWGSLKDLNDIMADNQAEIEGRITHAEARRNRAMKIASAVQTGALVFGSLKGELVGPGEHELAPPEDRTAPPEKQAAPSGENATPGHENTPGKPDQPAEHQDPASHPDRAAAKDRQAETHDPNDPIARSGAALESVDPQSDKDLPRAATFDGLHKLTVLEDGRIIRCSVSCGELRKQYQEFLDSAMKDPERMKQAQDLDARLKMAEEGAKSKSRADRDQAARDAAKLEPELRSLGAKDLAAELGANVKDIQKLSANYSPDEIRIVKETLGKRFDSFAKKTVVQEQMSRLLAVSDSDINVRNAGLTILKEGYGELSDHSLAAALEDLAKLQSQVPGYVTPEFLGGYEEALAKGDTARARSLLKTTEPSMREAHTANSKAALRKELAPLEARLDVQERNRQKVRTEETAAEAEIKGAAEAQRRAVAKMDAARTPEAREQAHQEAIAARDRLKAARDKLAELPSSSEAEKQVSRTKQAIDDVRQRLDPASRAPLPCFSADTMIWTSLGSRRIDKIQAGDVVLAFDFGEQRIVERHVLRVNRNQTDHFFNIRAGGASVRATGRHRFWIEGRNEWLPASELQPAMPLHLLEESVALVETAVLEEGSGPMDSYNLSIDRNPNFLVGPGLLVHNQGGFDTKLGGDITIYRGTNRKVDPDTVYVGKTIDVSAGGSSRGIEARQAEHRAWARKQLQNRANLSPENIKFYEFMSEVTLEELVTGLSSKEQGQFLEQRNMEIEEGLGKNVINRVEVINSAARLTRIEKAIKDDPAIINSPFCKK
jgi:hypothetical protein